MNDRAPMFKWHLLPALFVACTFAVASGAESDADRLRRLTNELEYGANAIVQSQAAFEIARMGEAAKSAVPALLRALGSKEAGVRSAATKALDKIGPVTAEVVPALTKAVADTDWGVQEAAIISLAGMGPAAKSSSPALIRALDNPFVGEQSVAALIAVAPGDKDVLAVLVKALAHPNDKVRAAVLAALGKAGACGGDNLPLVIGALSDKRSEVRARAAEVLCGLGRDSAPQIVPALVKALDDKDGGVRRSAVRSLGRMGSGFPEVLTAIRGRLDDQDMNVCYESMDALAEMGPAASAAVPELAKQADNFGRGNLRGMAARALGRIGPNAKPAVPHLARLLSCEGEGSSNNRDEAAIALGRLGPAAAEAIPALVKAGQTSGGAYIPWALQRMGPAGSQALAELLTSQAYNIPEQAMERLRGMGSGADVAVPKLAQVLESAGPQLKPGIRNDLLGLLAELGPRAEPAVPSILKLPAWKQEGPDGARARADLADVLGKIGPGAAGAVPALAKALGSAKGYEQERLFVALAGIGVAGKDVLASAQTAMKHENPRIRAAAAGVLWRIGGQEEPAASELQRILSLDFDRIGGVPDDPIRAIPVAADMLGLVGPDAKKAVLALEKSAGCRYSLARAVSLRALWLITRDRQKVLPRMMAFKPYEEHDWFHEDSARADELVTRALEGLDTEGRKVIIPGLIEALKAGDSSRKTRAFRLLGCYGTDAKDAVPALCEFLKLDFRGDSLPLIGAAADALGRIGPEAKDAEKPLKACIERHGSSATKSPLLPLRVEDALDRISPKQYQEPITAGPPVQPVPPGAEIPGEIGSMVRALDGNDRFARYRVAEALGNAGASAGPAAMALAKALESDDARLRFAAADALAKIGPEAREAVPALIRAIETKADVAGACVKALGAIRPTAKEAVTALEGYLQDQGSSDAAFALGYMGPAAKSALPALAKAVETGKRPELQRSAMWAIARIDPEAETSFPIYMKALGNKDRDVRATAATMMGELPARAKEAVPEIIKLLDDKEEGPRIAAAKALGVLGIQASGAVPKLAGLLKYEGASADRTRLAAAWALGLMGPEAKEAAGPLADAVATTGLDCYRTAMRALRSIGPESAPALAKVLPNMKDESRRREILAFMKDMGPEAKAAVPDLVKLLADKGCSSQTIEVLGAIGPEAKSATSALTGTITAARTPEGRQAFPIAPIIALGHIGPDAKDGIAVLQWVVVNAPEPRPRIEAMRALGRIGPAASGASAQLLQAMTDKAPATRCAAAYALCRVTGQEEPGMSEIVKTLEQKDLVFYRPMAMEMAAELGVAAKKAAPALEKAAEDKSSPNSQILAIRALWAVSGDTEKCMGRMLDIPKLSNHGLPSEGYDRYSDALAEMGRANPAVVVPRLIKEYETSRSADKTVLADALGKIGQAASDAVPALTKRVEQARIQNGLLISEDRDCSSAVQALGMLGAAAKDVIPKLTALRERTSEWHFQQSIDQAVYSIRADCSQREKRKD